jgi:carbon-monoxide dehydrogenase small subunit
LPKTNDYRAVFRIRRSGVIEENPHPDEDYVKDYLRGNFCRCIGYVAMVKSVLDAAEN